MRIVVIGGGTGSFTVLRGLKGKVEHLTSIVTMFDSGGSAGLLRDEFGILPPGDVRRGLVALADEDDMLRKLFMFRFDEHSSLQGHSFGNLFLTALTEITGNEAEAIKHAAKILRIKGEVLPVSLDHSHVCAELNNKLTIRTEKDLSVPRHDPSLHVVRCWLEPEAKAHPEAVDAILKADMIVVGPGGLFWSIVPNLLVKGIPEALRRAKGKKVYVCNLMTNPGETAGFKASDYVKTVVEYGLTPDVVICNTAQGAPMLLRKYSNQNQFPVIVDDKELEKLGVKIVKGDVMSASEIIRHDSEKLSKLLVKLV